MKKKPQQPKNLWNILWNIIEKLSLFAIAFAIILNIWNLDAEFNNRLNFFLVTTDYNKSILDTYMPSIEEGNFETKIFTTRFSVDMYKNNLDLLSTFSESCAEEYLKIITQMDIANLKNDALLGLDIQKGLIFESNQLHNTKEQEAVIQKALRDTLTELNTNFASIDKDSGCKPRPKSFLGFFPGFKNEKLIEK